MIKRVLVLSIVFLFCLCNGHLRAEAPTGNALLLLTSTIEEDIKINEDSDGKTFYLFKNQILSLSLPENPSTGYRWWVEEYSPDILEQLDASFIPSKPGNLTPIGSGGRKEYHFQTKRIGKTDLKLFCCRLWEELENPAKTFSIKIEVLPKIDKPRAGH